MGGGGGGGGGGGAPSRCCVVWGPLKVLIPGGLGAEAGAV